MSTRIKAVVILDFDYTLFDTVKFKISLAKSLKKFGVNGNLFFRLYRKSISINSDGAHSYDMSKHLKLISHQISNFPIRLAYNSLIGVIKESDLYLYGGARHFIKRLNGLGCKLVLVTYGDRSFQKKKLYYSGITKHFYKVIFIQRGVKGAALENFPVAVSKIFFISDQTGELNHVKRYYSHILPIMKVGGYGVLKDAKRLHIPAFRNLSQIEKYIIDYHKKSK